MCNFAELAAFIKASVNAFVPQDPETGKFILCLGSDPEQEEMHLWLPMGGSGATDATEALARSYGVLRAVQDLLMDGVTALCGVSPKTLMDKVLKWMYNTNQRIRSGTIGVKTLAERKESAGVWKKNWYDAYTKRELPENWPVTKAEALNKAKALGQYGEGKGIAESGNGTGAEVALGSGSSGGNNTKAVGGASNRNKKRVRVS